MDQIWKDELRKQIDILTDTGKDDEELLKGKKVNLGTLNLILLIKRKHNINNNRYC